MARVKQTVTQRSFAQGVVREDVLERDDSEVRQRSLRGGKNLRALASEAIEARWGTFYRRTLTGQAEDFYEIRPTSGLSFGLIVTNTRLQIVNREGELVHEETSVPWVDASDVWVEGFRERTVIGSVQGIRVLTYSPSGWTFLPWSFASGIGGEVAQPYWVFAKGVTLRPSARTGSITLTASQPIFSPTWVGMRVRYHRREVEITSYISATVVQATVITTLPPSFNIQVETGAEYRVGEAVVGADSNFQGVITAIAGDILVVAALEVFQGPDVGEFLSGPSASSKVTFKGEREPQASSIWDEPLMSNVRGWPQSAAAVAGRLMLLNFREAPDAVAVSSRRSIEDFTVGLEDDDAIVRAIGDNQPQVLHAVNVGDVVILTDRGCYYVSVRENNALTPSTFDAILFDRRGASSLRPAQVDDGLVFIEASGKNVLAALLSGNVYLKWTIRSITLLYPDLVRDPVRVCGPALNSQTVERYVFIVNADGTLAAVSYQDSLSIETVGFVPWDTDGRFINVAPAFGRYWAIVDRDTSAGVVRYLEEFDDAAYLDCAVQSDMATESLTLLVNGADLTVNGLPLTVATAVLAYLPGVIASIYQDGAFAGHHYVEADGTIPTAPELVGPRQIGLNYIAAAEPWPVELVQSERVGMVQVRVSRFGVSMQGSRSFQVRTNRTTRTVGAYNFGDDLSAAPPARTRVYKFPVFGTRDHPEMEVIKHEPGPWRVLAMIQEVQG